MKIYNSTDQKCYCTTGWHKDGSGCKSNKDSCDDYVDPNCKDCDFFSWKTDYTNADGSKSDYCGGWPWWVWLLAILGLLLGLALLAGLIGLCCKLCCGKKKGSSSSSKKKKGGCCNCYWCLSCSPCCKCFKKCCPKSCCEDPNKKKVVQDDYHYQQERIPINVQQNKPSNYVERPPVHYETGRTSVVYQEPRVHEYQSGPQTQVSGQRVLVETRTFSPGRENDAKVTYHKDVDWGKESRVQWQSEHPGYKEDVVIHKASPHQQSSYGTTSYRQAGYNPYQEQGVTVSTTQGAPRQVSVSGGGATRQYAGNTTGYSSNTGGVELVRTTGGNNYASGNTYTTGGNTTSYRATDRDNV